MKINILRAVLVFLLLGTFYIIFGFSGQDGKQSESISRQITENITKNIKMIHKLDKKEKEQKLNVIEYIIRKIAHFLLYTIVGILLMSLMCTYNLKTKIRIGTTSIIGLLYAISDEIHQSFIPDRSPQITDVIIDFVGVIFGITIIFFALKIYKLHINNF